MSSSTIDAVLRNAATALADSSESPRLDAQVLLLHVLRKPRSYLFAWGDKALEERQLREFEKLLSQRLQGVPVAHLTGTREFWSLPLAVNSSTLIPRPDTETLVEQALALDLPENAQVLDLGTGTGAIALALASERQQWQVQGVDASADAVTLAMHNQQSLGIANVRIYQSDWFSAIAAQRFDLIVSNPPYIDESDPHLSVGDVRYEPLSALVAKDNGLADIDHIIAQARAYLHPGATLMLEHGFEQGQAVRQLLTNYGYVNARTVVDLGQNERITLAEYTT
ncbi:peptide chain release factor N(5)-glutamine methyltransferase [Pseudoalteromonas sp. CNC9-20]|uniref:peptide chain release factor N(5)-glutamine methyltransferase n=1 Tax=Pseudoalteromonas TaxID=53246 RepID=UPI00034C2ECB|nr:MULTISPECIES: peptide chain release factor N(5)-glutamine methyltransferase [Pseudoalteromonas]MCG7571105.1 peptide chain release factor N(5)-glutamine methyltransferase [Pseudoalteromonas sp. CNC9-20]